MAHPRFAVVAGGLRPSSSSVAWPDADSAAEPLPTGKPWFAWRLLGGNNRELGRSARIYPDDATCRLGAAAARDAASTLTVSLTVDVRRGMWRWRLEEQDGAVAVSSRLYLRQRECSYSLAQFLAGLEVATLWGEATTSGPALPPFDVVLPGQVDERVEFGETLTAGPTIALPSADVVIDLREPGPLQAGMTTRARQSAEWSRRRYVEARRTSAQLRSR